ncbi:hypothetical protein TNCV_440101 [Trichonephila clavipes]|nr:hypothetical protein TNCV_440101 [Trichonephila clavipes]
MFGQRVAVRQQLLTGLRELRRALVVEWCNIPQDQIDNLILSMPKRCADYIATYSLQRKPLIKKPFGSYLHPAAEKATPKLQLFLPFLSASSKNSWISSSCQKKKEE